VYLEKMALSAPAIDLVNNVDASIESDPARIKDALVRQAYSPVRWVECVNRMVQSGVTHIVECGPGKVLAGLTKRIAPETQSFALADRASLEQALHAIGKP
jgi:[acyl-carrier-protein] S-malonyltransferase